MPVFSNSAQSPGVPPLDSTSLTMTDGIATAAQSFVAPFVEVAVVANEPTPSGQRPYVVATAWDAQV